MQRYPENEFYPFVVEFMNRHSLSLLRYVFTNNGTIPYDSILVYGYAAGVFFCRTPELITDTIQVYIVTSPAISIPDHDTVAIFRKRFSGEPDLFHRILIIAHETGILMLGVVSIESKKVKTNTICHVYAFRNG